MLSMRRVLLANVYYMQRPLWRFLPLLLAVTGLLLLGAVAFHVLPESRKLSYVEGLYQTSSLIFGEKLEPFPQHPLLQIICFVMPPLGFLIILDGFLRFSYHVLRRDANSKEWTRAVARTLSNHVILVGLGNVGIRVLQQLMRLDELVVVLEKDANSTNLSYANKHGVPVRIGHGREEGIFEDLNASKAKSIILCTDDDLANMEMALDAQKANSNIRVVMRLFDHELAEKVRDAFDVHLALSTSDHAAPVFATASTDRAIQNAFYAGERLLVVAEFAIDAPSPLNGRSIRDVATEHPVFFLTHRRAGKEELYPDASTQLQVGDQVVIQCEPDALKLLHP